MPLLNANIRAFKSHGFAEITQFIFGNLDRYMHFILIRNMETLYKTNSIVSFYFLIRHVVPSLFILLKSKKSLKGRRAMCCPIFEFPLYVTITTPPQ